MNSKFWLGGISLALLVGVGLAAWRAVRPRSLPPQGRYSVTRTASKDIWYPAIVGDTVRHPLIFLVPAMGRAPADYTTIATDLASLGNVVAGITPSATGPIDLEHREQAQPLVEIWIGDLQRDLNQLFKDPELRDKIAWDRVAAVGHSFGGAVAIQALVIDPRLRAAVNLDGAPQGKPVTGLRRPALFILGAPLPPAQKALNDRILGEIQATCNSSGENCRIIDHPEAGHMNFSDSGLNPAPVQFFRKRQDLGDLDGAVFLRQVVGEIQHFLEESRRRAP